MEPTAPSRQSMPGPTVEWLVRWMRWERILASLRETPQGRMARAGDEPARVAA